MYPFYKKCLIASLCAIVECTENKSPEKGVQFFNQPYYLSLSLSFSDLCSPIACSLLGGWYSNPVIDVTGGTRI